jgi:hypothetical protein
LNALIAKIISSRVPKPKRKSLSQSLLLKMNKARSMLYSVGSIKEMKQTVASFSLGSTFFYGLR